MSNPILDAARQRLLAIASERAALDREERELRAMVAAAEGAATTPPSPAPIAPCPPTVDPLTPFVPAPSLPTPWIVKRYHGGMCACPQCCPPWTLGGAITFDGSASTIYIGDVNPSAGSVTVSGSCAGDPALITSQN